MLAAFPALEITASLRQHLKAPNRQLAGRGLPSRNAALRSPESSTAAETESWQSLSDPLTPFVAAPEVSRADSSRADVPYANVSRTNVSRTNVSRTDGSRHLHSAPPSVAANLTDGSYHHDQPKTADGAEPEGRPRLPEQQVTSAGQPAAPRTRAPFARAPRVAALAPAPPAPKSGSTTSGQIFDPAAPAETYPPPQPSAFGAQRATGARTASRGTRPEAAAPVGWSASRPNQPTTGDSASESSEPTVAASAESLESPLSRGLRARPLTAPPEARPAPDHRVTPEPPQTSSRAAWSVNPGVAPTTPFHGEEPRHVDSHPRSAIGSPSVEAAPLTADLETHDRLAERLERILRDDARRHGIEL